MIRKPLHNDGYYLPCCKIGGQKRIDRSTCARNKATPSPLREKRESKTRKNEFRRESRPLSDNGSKCSRILGRRSVGRLFLRQRQTIVRGQGTFTFAIHHQALALMCPNRLTLQRRTRTTNEIPEGPRGLTNQRLRKQQLMHTCLTGSVLVSAQELIVTAAARRWLLSSH